MPTLVIDNQQIFFAHRAARDTETTPPLLLLHGAASSHLDWPAQLRRLPHTAVYALDLPGHGKSDPPGCQSIAAYTAVVNKFVTQLGLPQVVVLGHSMGGAIAQQLGREQPAWLAGLVLLGTAAVMPVNPTMLEQIQTDYTAVVDFLVRYQWSKNVPESLRQLSYQRLQQNDPAVVYGDFYACNQFDARPYLADIQLPTLVIGGTADKMTPFSQSQFLADNIPHSQLIAIEGAGHYLSLERPVEVSQAVAEFLAQFAG